jgi:ankyrin repeat protein
LLAQLLMDSFQLRLKVKPIKADLKSLPKGVDAYDTAYDDAMARIFGQEKDHREAARRSLSLVLCCKRPLRTIELQHALMVESDDTELDEDNNLEVEDILSVCAGLITTDKESDTVRFVHYTTQDYLERTQEQWLPRAEFEIARTCLDSFLAQMSSLNQGISNGRTNSENTNSGLLGYALKHGPSHWDAIVKVEKSLRGGLLLLLNGSRTVLSIEQTVSYIAGINLVGGSTPVDWIVHFGFLDLMKICIVNQHVYDALPYAARKGRVSVVRLLLEYNVAARARVLDLGAPLSIAAGNGHEPVVRLLLKHGANVNARNLFDQTALSYATTEGHESVMQLLLDSNATIDLPDSYGQTPLAKAAIRGHASTVQLLLRNDAVVDSRDTHGRTPLSYAVAKGFEEIVQSLLEHDAAIDLEDNRGRTPLMHAATLSHVSMARCLLEHNAAVNSKDYSGWTVLLHAVKRRHKPMVRLLLEHDAVADTVLLPESDKYLQSIG